MNRIFLIRVIAKVTKFSDVNGMLEYQNELNEGKQNHSFFTMQSAGVESDPKLILTRGQRLGLVGPEGPNRADFLRSKDDSSAAELRACTSDPHEQTVHRRRPGRPGRRGSPCGASCWP